MKKSVTHADMLAVYNPYVRRVAAPPHGADASAPGAKPDGVRV